MANPPYNSVATNIVDGDDNTRVLDVVTAAGGINAIPIVNPDGSNVGGAGGTASTDSATFTPTTTSGTPIEAAVDDSAPHTVADGKVGIVRMTTSRVLRQVPSDGSGNTLALGADYDATTAGVVNKTPVFFLGMYSASNAAYFVRTAKTQALTANVGNSVVPTALFGTNSSTFDAVRTTGDNADAQATLAAGVLRVTAEDFLFNGSTWDRRYGNFAATALASASRGLTTTSSADLTSYNATSIIVILNVTAASGTGGLQIRIQAKDSISGNYANLNAAPTAITTTGTFVYVLGPSPTAQGDVQQATSGRLSRTFRITVTGGDTSSYTYSVSYELA